MGRYGAIGICVLFCLLTATSSAYADEKNTQWVPYTAIDERIEALFPGLFRIERGIQEIDGKKISVETISMEDADVSLLIMRTSVPYNVVYLHRELLHRIHSGYQFNDRMRKSERRVKAGTYSGMEYLYGPSYGKKTGGMSLRSFVTGGDSIIILAMYNNKGKSKEKFDRFLESIRINRKKPRN